LTRQFDFGGNWADFSRKAATPEKARQAAEHFAELLSGIDLRGRTFLDIGFGQGFSLLSASSMGARAVGCDINPKCHDVIERNRGLFDAGSAAIGLQVGSILDPAVVGALRARPEAAAGGYDVVHSWGVLHHTGDMARALTNAASLVRPGGHLVIAIYNRHWTSLAWVAIKAAYVHAPRFMQRALVGLLYPVIWLAKLAVTRRDPKTTDRGMDFYYDVVDWVGGYPYEYASVGELQEAARPLGLELVRAIPAKVPTGCNEFVFRKDA
jgi:2-polyprenyl-6-hydroxyphenyl methylase/3-demethylubiquinone-9 3-methyltransferase